MLYFPILVESGLKRLEKSPSTQSLIDQHRDRLFRFDFLSFFNSYSLIHLSDEEGLDGESFYHLLPDYVTVFRNFNHPRLLSLHSNIVSLPIGPRHVFLDNSLNSLFLPASERTYPWSFMGTLWPNGSRKLAVSHFLRSIPSGF